MTRGSASRVVRAALAAALAALGLLAPAARAADDPVEQSPFGGELPPQLTKPASQTMPPPGFEVSAAEAIEIAAATEVVRDELAETPGGDADRAGCAATAGRSAIDADGTEVAQVIVDGGDGSVDEAWRDYQVETHLARGYEGAIAQNVNSPWIWLPLCLLFVAPFFDPRRPLRLLHLDLLVLLGLGISLFFFNRAEITASVALTYPVLGYFLVRMLVAGLLAARARGAAGAAGAGPLAGGRRRRPRRGPDRAQHRRLARDRHRHGRGGRRRSDRRRRAAVRGRASRSGSTCKGDVYGPVNYLSYVPFELALPLGRRLGRRRAGRARGGDLLRPRLRRRPPRCSAAGCATATTGRALGWALAFAWVACPWTLYTMNANANDALIAALGIGALLSLRSAPGAGRLRRRSPRRRSSAPRRWRRCSRPPTASAAGAGRCGSRSPSSSSRRSSRCRSSPTAGLREIYDRTLGYQAARSSPFSVWGQAPSLDFLQPLVRAAAVALAVGVAFYPRTSSRRFRSRRWRPR